MEKNLAQINKHIHRVVLFGPESTGKTTLAKQLASHYNTRWVPEFARQYLQKKWDEKQEICTVPDLIPIAKGQMSLENKTSNLVDRLLICDTNLFQTQVYAQWYFDGHCPKPIKKMVQKNQYLIYLLMQVDVTWEKDDLRDRPNDREAMFTYFKDSLEQHDMPFAVVQGNGHERLEKCIRIIDKAIADKMELTEKDTAQLEQMGIDVNKVDEQVGIFKKGIPFVQLDRAAVIGDGIEAFDTTRQDELVEYFNDKSNNISLLKFVPASGAASRMFKAMFNFLDDYQIGKEDLASYLERTSDSAVEQLSGQVHKLAFYDLLQKGIAKKGLNGEDKIYNLVKEMLGDDGLGYGSYPKGMLPFHNYGKGGTTPFHEHLKEAAQYANSNGSAKLHFTISEQHSGLFHAEEERVKKGAENRWNVNYEISYSYQKPSTDTLSVNPDNTPFRNQDGSLLFRPGGHGALIENLNDQDADIIFIKNIDNVVTEQHLEEISRQKKILGGYLLKVQDQCHAYCQLLEQGSASGEELDAIAKFAKENLNILIPAEFGGFDSAKKSEWLFNMMNRPIRVCGMVKNEGEPGGGPFWINDSEGKISLQIIESAQIDGQNDGQMSILKGSTHFNPVDLVCAVKNYKGEKFDLTQFIDHTQGFITAKTKEGRDLKALELPGLWNGAMAFWNTIFVEVPLITFNPVKTVNDLLKPAHQFEG